MRRSVHYCQRSTRTFFALSDPKHRGVLERLGRAPATLSQLAGPSGLTRNGIKKHVGVLELAAHRRAWEGRLDRFVERAG